MRQYNNVYKMEQQRRYPLGEQSFSKLREQGRVYVDKTEHVYRLTHLSSDYIFLSRPRRFGKSLLTSTLRCYFEGRRDLFKGLAIERMEKDWTAYPVLHFDMSGGKNLSRDSLIKYILDILKDNERRMDIDPEGGEEPNIRMKNLISNVYRKTGKQVVVLIDEYDAPLLDVMHEENSLKAIRDTVQTFYKPLKAAGEYLRFVFLTGITKFSQLSIFSALNNIMNVSMDKEFADICGITAEELTTQMLPDIDLLGENLGKSREETIKTLCRNYDGYHFTWPSPDIYNPYSLLTAFAKKEIGSYWFGSGTPTYLIEMLRKYKVKPQEIGGRKCQAQIFDAPTERMTDITPLLYQSGYITIKDYNSRSRIYTLDIPNKEVRLGLTGSLMPNYISPAYVADNLVWEMYDSICNGDIDGALRQMQTVLGSVPYTRNARSEGHFQSMLYLLFTLIGQYTDVEVHTATGRIDMVVHAPDRLYIMELKIRDSVESALEQIDLKRYADRFALLCLPITKVGITFDIKKRTIRDWKIM